MISLSHLVVDVIRVDGEHRADRGELHDSEAQVGLEEHRDEIPRCIRTRERDWSVALGGAVPLSLRW